MTSDKDLRDNTKALNNLAKVCKALDDNLTRLARMLQNQQEPEELHGVCASNECSTPKQIKHNHGIGCSATCPCASVRERTSRQFAAYINSYPVPVGNFTAGDATSCRDFFCENEEKHIHGKACGKSCSEPVCYRG